MTSDRSNDKTTGHDATTSGQDASSTEKSEFNQPAQASERDALSSVQMKTGIHDEDENDKPSSDTSARTDTAAASAARPFSQAAASQRGEQPVADSSGEVTQRPALAASPMIALGDAARGFLRGMMPPQGLDVFLEEVRTTASQVADMYGNLFRYQVDSVERTLSETRLGRGRALEDQEHGKKQQ